jgi:N-acetylmuramoyl-L-alanine amidase
MRLVPLVKLQPAFQKVVATSEPSGADVLEAGSVIGKTPFERTAMPGTEVTYRFKLEGYEETRVEGMVKVGETLKLSATLKPIRAPSSDSDEVSKEKSEVSNSDTRGWNIVKIGDADYVDIESIKRFYSFTKLLRNNDDLVLENAKVEARFQIGSDFCILNGVKFRLFEKVTSQGDMALLSRMDLARVLDPVLRPNFVKGAQDFGTVILNPLAGGGKTAGIDPHGTGAEFALSVAKRCAPLLQEKGFKVILTRPDSQGVSRDECIRKVNSVNEPAVLISIGFASGEKGERGIRTFVCDPTMPRSSVVEIDTYAPSLCLATSVQGSALRRLQKHTLDGGVSRILDPFMNQVKHPAVLFEGGFFSHPDEARLIGNEVYQNALANALVDAVGKYRYAVQRNSDSPHEE